MNAKVDELVAEIAPPDETEQRVLFPLSHDKSCEPV